MFETFQMFDDSAGTAELKPQCNITLRWRIAVVIDVRDYTFQYLSLTRGGTS